MSDNRYKKISKIKFNIFTNLSLLSIVRRAAGNGAQGGQLPTVLAILKLLIYLEDDAWPLPPVTVFFSRFFFYLRQPPWPDSICGTFFVSGFYQFLQGPWCASIFVDDLIRTTWIPSKLRWVFCFYLRQPPWPDSICGTFPWMALYQFLQGPWCASIFVDYLIVDGWRRQENIRKFKWLLFFLLAVAATAGQTILRAFSFCGWLAPRFFFDDCRYSWYAAMLFLALLSWVVL